MNDILIKNFETVMLKSIKLNGVFNLAVSGGSTPIKLFNQLAHNFKNSDEWKLNQRFVNVFWVDERCVEANNMDSNCGVFLKIFDSISLNYFPLDGINKKLDKEAKRYEKLIKSKVLTSDLLIPNFDLILLGFGNDGHIASLFPDSEALKENKKFIVKNYVKLHAKYRLTMTYPLILNSKNIFLIYRKDKKELLNKIITNKVNTPLNHILDNYKNLIKYEII